MKRVLAFAAAIGAVAAAVPAQATRAVDYSVFASGNLSTGGGSIGGNIAVGGNATFGNFSAATGLGSSANGSDTVVVGGKLTASSGTIAHGSAVAGSLALPQYSVNFQNGSSRVGTGSIDFAAEAAALSYASSTLAGTAANGTTLFQYGGLNFTGTNAINIFTVSGADLASTTNFNVNAPAGSLVIFNISGITDQFSGGINLTGIGASNVLYNFFQATTLNLNNIGVQGTILAPNATLNFNNGNVDGQVLVKNVASNGQISISNTRYAGTLPAPTAAVPEPGTWAMMITGFGIIGFSMRRRRRATGTPAIA